MRLMRLTLINMKRQLKNPLFLIMSLVMPVILVVNVFGGRSKEEMKVIGSIGIINSSNSVYSEKLVENLSERYDVSHIIGEEESNGDNIRNLIMDNKLMVVYEIGEDFQGALEKGKIPKIKCYRTEGTTGTIIAENIITTYINSVAKESVSEGLSLNAITTEITNSSNDKSKGTTTTAVLMICYFMMIGGSVITDDLLKLKSQKVLKRTISTANSDKEVVGSIFLAAFLIQGLISTVGFFVVKPIIKLENCNIPLIILVIFLGSLVATAIVSAATRWIKNPSMASLFVVLYGLLSYGAGMAGTISSSLESVPAIITRISTISPFAWLFKIMETGEILIPTLVIVLMSIVFFTAGSFRLREFAKE